MESAHTPPEPAVPHARLSDVPADLLANRVVGSLIMLKGNLNLYDLALERFIVRTRAEAAEDRADLLAMLIELADACDFAPENSARHQDLIDRVRAAIAKAQGPQNPGESSREAMQDGAGPGRPLSDGGL
jgi:hypothetical protein